MNWKLHTLINYWDHEHEEDHELGFLAEAMNTMETIVKREQSATSFVFTLVPTE